MRLVYTISDVIPAFYAGVSERCSDIWGKTITLEPGQSYAISAASGKGKSTLLNLLYAVRSAPNGSIKLGDLSLADFTPNKRCELRRVDVSMVFQDLLLFEHLSARDNLKLKHSLHSEVSENMIWQWCERLDIQQHLDRPCHQLSLGQQQRVAIVRALIQPFSWLLMDEPTSHLDKENTQRVHQLVDEVCAQRLAGKVITTLEKHPEFSYDKILFC
jgi:ABC-type lipoprotein export system ATPase subunit